MDELREVHLGIPLPPGAPRPSDELRAAYRASAHGGAGEAR
jgi:hypothetical protein